MLDVTERLRLHVAYSLKRDRWARRALALLAQGNDEAAALAADWAELWDLKAKALEPSSGITRIAPALGRGRG